MATQREDRRDKDAMQRALIGTAAAVTAGGLAYLIGRKLMEEPERYLISDAPRSTLRGRAGRGAPIQRTVTIGRPRSELYAFWRHFPNLAKVMENVERIDAIDRERSHWVVKAPGGGTVEWDSIVTEDQPDRLIAWRSADGADIVHRGRIEFIDAAPGRGTMVRATIDYSPPAGAAGRAIAKLLQREPAVQARRDLRRFKQFMETGEVTSSAGPSGRKNESPTEQTL